MGSSAGVLHWLLTAGGIAVTVLVVVAVAFWTVSEWRGREGGPLEPP